MRSTMTKPPLLLAAPHRLPFLTGSLGLGSTAAWWLFVLVQIHAGCALFLWPTSFVLPPEAVDRLRAAAGTIILASPEFQRLLKDIGAKIVEPPAGQRAP